jgi:heme-degrading monooxygenase HmoA
MHRTPGIATPIIALAGYGVGFMLRAMAPAPIQTDAVAVIFSAQRSADDESGYAAAAVEMELLAADQPGYLGIESARGADGFGVTVSYWTDDAAALAWRDHPLHSAIRERGRAFWYDRYRITVARVTRGYGWTRG